MRTPDAALAVSRRRWWTLAGACAGAFVIALGSTAVMLTLPAIRLELGASAAGVQWVPNAFLLAATALVVTAGRLAGRIGQRPVLLAGLLVFGAGSALCAVADSMAPLIAGRAVQGAGAAAALGLSPGIVGATFGDGRRVLWVWAAAAGLGLALGPLVGAAVLELWGWRALFWLNVPAVAAAVIALALAVPPTRAETDRPALDGAGLFTGAAGLSGVVVALVQGSAAGWDAPATLGLLAGGVALLVAFWHVESRAAEPLVDVRRLHTRSFVGAAAATLAAVGAYYTIAFLLPQYAQFVLGASTLNNGVLLLAITGPAVVLWGLGLMLAGRLGARAVIPAGLLCGAAGMVGVAVVDPGSGVRALLPGLVLFGSALGLVCAPAAAVLRAVAAGPPALGRLLAGAVGLAAGGALAQEVQVQQRAAGGSFESAFSDSLTVTAGVLAAVLVAAALIAALLVRPAPWKPSAAREALWLP